MVLIEKNLFIVWVSIFLVKKIKYFTADVTLMTNTFGPNSGKINNAARRVLRQREQNEQRHGREWRI